MVKIFYPQAADYETARMGLVGFKPTIYRIVLMYE